MDMDTNNRMNEETPIYTHIHFVCTSLAASYAGGGHLVRSRRRCNPRSSGTLGPGDAERLVLPDSLFATVVHGCAASCSGTRAWPGGLRRQDGLFSCLRPPSREQAVCSTNPLHRANKQASKCFSCR